MNGDYGKGGLLVFTKQPFAKTSATISDTNLQFKASDSIYMTAFLAEQFGSDNMDKYLSLEIKILPVGDVKFAQTGYLAHAMEINYGSYNGEPTNVLPMEFLPAGGKSAKYQAQVGEIARTLRKLPKGVHIVQLRIVSNMQGAAAVGAFYYDNSTGQGGGNALDATLKSVTMPAPAQRNPQLEKEIAKYLNSMGGGSGTPVLKVVIVDRAWTPLRNEYGVVVGRAIGAVVAIKGSDGVCFRENHTYVTNTNGSGLELEGTRERMDMACENAQK